MHTVSYCNKAISITDCPNLLPIGYFAYKIRVFLLWSQLLDVADFFFVRGK